MNALTKRHKLSQGCAQRHSHDTWLHTVLHSMMTALIKTTIIIIIVIIIIIYVQIVVVSTPNRSKHESSVTLRYRKLQQVARQRRRLLCCCRSYTTTRDLQISRLDTKASPWLEQSGFSHYSTQRERHFDAAARDKYAWCAELRNRRVLEAYAGTRGRISSAGPCDVGRALRGTLRQGPRYCSLPGQSSLSLRRGGNRRGKADVVF